MIPSNQKCWLKLYQESSGKSKLNGHCMTDRDYVGAGCQHCSIHFQNSKHTNLGFLVWLHVQYTTDTVYNTEFKYICVLEKNTVIIRLMKFTRHIICNQVYV